jgi:hypothetical protein
MMARRRKIDLLEAGIDILFKKWFGGFWGLILGGFAKKLKAELIKWLSEKWITEDLNEFPEGDEQELLP